jgi:hypothetical protein
MASDQAEGLESCQLGEHQSEANNLQVEASAVESDYLLERGGCLAHHIEDHCDQIPKREEEEFLPFQSRYVRSRSTAVLLHQIDVDAQEDDEIPHQFK